jgi:hypothetical protein
VGYIRKRGQKRKERKEKESRKGETKRELRGGYFQTTSSPKRPKRNRKRNNEPCPK